MTAPPPLPSAGRADRARRAASTVDPSNPIRPGPRSCPRRVGHGRHPGPWTKDQEAEWATSMRVGHQHALRASGPHHANGPMGHMPDRSCGPRESPCGDGHADHLWSMDRAGRWRPRPPGHGPRTIWAGRRADPVHAVHGPRAHRHRAGLPKRTWSGAMRIARRIRNRCRIPDSRRTGSRPWTSPRSAGAGTRRGRHARPPCGSRPRTNSGTTDTYAK